VCADDVFAIRIQLRRVPRHRPNERQPLEKPVQRDDEFEGVPNLI
jgi:hypothetical protein